MANRRATGLLLSGAIGSAVIGSAVIMSAVIMSAAWAQAPGRFDGQYAGELTLTGIINGDCTKPPIGARYPLTVTGGWVRFKYVPRFDTTLTGRVDDKGNFKATARLHHGFATMTGHIDPVGDLTANIVSPSCLYSFQVRN